MTDSTTSENSRPSTTQEVSLSDQVLFAFNRVFIDFVKDVKSKDKNLGHIIKKKYSALDRQCADYFNEWCEVVKPNESEWLAEGDLLLNDVVRDSEVIRDISVADIAIAIDVTEHPVLAVYLNTLLLLSRVRNEDWALEVLSALATGGSGVDLADETAKAILGRIAFLREKSTVVPPPETEAPSERFGSALPTPPEGFFEESRIGQLAKEITSKIDMSSLTSQKPEDLMNMNNLFNGSNPAITNIIQQVGSTISEKIANGDLRQEDLVADAMALMSKMNMNGSKGGPNMANMMKNMMSMFGNAGGAGGLGSKPRRGRETREDLRSRLKKKMEDRAAPSSPALEDDDSFTQ